MSPMVQHCTTRSVAAMSVGVGVGLERPLDDDVEVVLAQERHEQVDGLLGRVPVPPATDDEGSALLGHGSVS